MKVTALQSPNSSQRPVGTHVDCIVLHCDASTDAKASISWIRSPESKVSYHTLIDRNGDIYHFVDPARKAWHAGKSAFMGRDNVNDFSIGLSFANRNDGEPYTDAQIQSAVYVCKYWMARFKRITPERVTTHAIVATPAGRKSDPVGFDLAQFRTLLGGTP